MSINRTTMRKYLRELSAMQRDFMARNTNATMFLEVHNKSEEKKPFLAITASVFLWGESGVKKTMRADIFSCGIPEKNEKEIQRLKNFINNN